ncbi:MAG: TIGR00725 family protein [Chitinophagales bacterium]|nr:TIGR00725 family protein [Chitinophagales bacterium]MDW8394373.1 TIGR00725 family protein [Chitinophagales bacterium]
MLVGTIGPNTELCSPELYAFGVDLGKALAEAGHLIVCGGEGGFMEAVCRGVKESSQSFFGQTIGLLPALDAAQANPYVDVPLPTGMGVMRNVLIVRAAQVLIAAGGGAGTLSELAMAWQHGKRVICLTSFGGWTAELAGRNLDHRYNHLLLPAATLEEVLQKLG